MHVNIIKFCGQEYNGKNHFLVLFKEIEEEIKIVVRVFQAYDLLDP